MSGYSIHHEERNPAKTQIVFSPPMLLHDRLTCVALCLSVCDEMTTLKFTVQIKSTARETLY